MDHEIRHLSCDELLALYRKPVAVIRWADDPVLPHNHGFIEIAIILAGNPLHLSAAGKARLQRGGLAVVLPGAWHAFEQMQQTEIINCCFAPEILRREAAWMKDDPGLDHLLWSGPRSNESPGVLLESLDESALQKTLARLESLAQVIQDPKAQSRTVVIGALQMVLGELAWHVGAGITPSPQIPDAVLQAIRLLDTEMNHAWTLPKLAARIYLDPCHFDRLFKTHVGRPPMAYLARCRAERAAAMLLATTQPVAEVGQAVGWCDPNHFARRFRSFFGTSPTHYRTHFRSLHASP